MDAGPPTSVVPVSMAAVLEESRGTVMPWIVIPEKGSAICIAAEQ